MVMFIPSVICTWQYRKPTLDDIVHVYTLCTLQMYYMYLINIFQEGLISVHQIIEVHFH